MAGDAMQPLVGQVSLPVQVRFADVDMAGHVHNSVYLHWFELARMRFLEQVVPTGNDWGEQGLILARNEVDHRMPVRLHDQVEAAAWCSAIGRSSFDLSYRIRRTGGGPAGICAEGRSVLVCFDYTLQKSKPIPHPWLSRLEALVIAT
jgi:acyl-CoA thioester hydrolase